MNYKDRNTDLAITHICIRVFTESRRYGIPYVFFYFRIFRIPSRIAPKSAEFCAIHHMSLSISMSVSNTRPRSCPSLGPCQLPCLCLCPCPCLCSGLRDHVCFRSPVHGQVQFPVHVPLCLFPPVSPPLSLLALSPLLHLSLCLFSSVFYPLYISLCLSFSRLLSSYVSPRISPFSVSPLCIFPAVSFPPVHLPLSFPLYLWSSVSPVCLFPLVSFPLSFPLSFTLCLCNSVVPFSLFLSLCLFP